jgi:hypothetical protein
MPAACAPSSRSGSDRVEPEKTDAATRSPGACRLKAALERDIGARLGRPLVAVKQTRHIDKRSMIHNDALLEMAVDLETYGGAGGWCVPDLRDRHGIAVRPPLLSLLRCRCDVW